MARTSGQMAQQHDVLHTLHELSGVVGLPVALNGATMLPIASTPHEGALDRSRMEMLLGRPAPAEVVDILTERDGIAESDEPRRVAPFAGLEMGRVHVPLRGAGGSGRGKVAGHLWIVDPGETTSASGLAELQAKAETALASILGEQTGGRQTRHRPAGAARALRLRLVPGDAYSPFGQTVVPLRQTVWGIGAGVLQESGGELDQDVTQLADGDVMATFTGRHGDLDADRLVTHLADGRIELRRSGIEIPGLLLAMSPVLTGEQAQVCEAALGLMLDMAERAGIPGRAARTAGAASAARAAGDAGAAAAAGADDGLIEGLVSAESLERASRAGIRLLADDYLFDLCNELGPVLPMLSAWRPFSADRLIDDPRGSLLVRTARVFLDAGGSVARTADRLEVHRGTVYYRLRQIEDITGLQLDDGRHRLLLHLGLTVSALTRAA